MPRRKAIFREIENARNKVMPADVLPRPVTLSKPVEEKENKMQRIHHIVRTATLDNQFHDTGAAPLGNIEKDINFEWLTKGWQVLSAVVLRVGPTEFEILYTLVQNVP